MRTTFQKVTLPKVPQLPGGSMKGTGGAGINHAKGTKDKTKGNTDDMADLARMKAAGAF